MSLAKWIAKAGQKMKGKGKVTVEIDSKLPATPKKSIKDRIKKGFEKGEIPESMKGIGVPVAAGAAGAYVLSKDKEDDDGDDSKKKKKKRPYMED